MIFFAVFFAAVAAFSGVRVIAGHTLGAAGDQLARIRADRGSDLLVEEGSNVGDRLIRPLSRWLLSRTTRLLPASVAQHFQEQLLAAGHPVSSQTFFALLIAGPIIGFALVGELMLSSGPPSPSMAIIQLGGALFVGGALPVYWLTGQVRRRQARIGRELPDAVDLIVVSVEAGLSLEAAMARVGDDPRHLIAAEFRRVLADLNLGMGRRPALQGLVARTGVPAINSFVSAILQADQTGMGIGQVLRAQSTQLRSQRKQRAEEAAMKAPLKMLFPLIFFIFPSLFVVILGPAVISLMDNLAK